MHLSRLWLFVAFTLIAAVQVNADQFHHLSDIDSGLEADVDAVCTAIKENDYQTQYNKLYTPLVQKFSKSKGVQELITANGVAASEKSDTSSLRIIAVRPVPPFTMASTPTHDYVLIPLATRINLKLDSGTQHVLEHGFMLAVRNHGDTKWQYIYDYLFARDDTSDVRTEFLPDLPAFIILGEIKSEIINE